MRAYACKHVKHVNIKTHQARYVRMCMGLCIHVNTHLHSAPVTPKLTVGKCISYETLEGRFFGNPINASSNTMPPHNSVPWLQFLKSEARDIILRVQELK